MRPPSARHDALPISSARSVHPMSALPTLADARQPDLQVVLG